MDLKLTEYFDKTLDTTDGADDYAKTIMRARLAYPMSVPLTILVEPSFTPYHCATPINAFRLLTLDAGLGASHGVPRAIFKWSKPIVGITSHFPTSWPEHPDGATGGSLFTARGIEFNGPGWGTGLGSHGMLAYNRIELYSCGFRNWGGEGVRVWSGPLPSGVGAVADFCLLEDVWIDACGASGIHTVGPNAQRCRFERVAANRCGVASQKLTIDGGRHGPICAAAHIWDESQLGNTWQDCDADQGIGADLDPSQGGGYVSLAPAYRATVYCRGARFADCYTEGGFGSEIDAPNEVDGGIMAIKPGWDGVFDRPQQYGKTIGPALVQPNHMDPTDLVFAALPDNEPGARIVGSFGSSLELDGPWRFGHGGATGYFGPWWVLQQANTDARSAFLIADGSLDARGYPPGTMWLPQQRTFYGANANSLEWVDTIPPDTARHRRGDLAINRGSSGPWAWSFDGSAWVPR